MEAMPVTVEAELTVARLHERYEQRALDLAHRIVGSKADAADAVREAFLDLTREPPSPTDDEATLASRLLAETRNACHALIQRRPGERAWEPDGNGEDREIGEANMRLPLRQREALALRELGLSYEEIAGIVEMRRGSVPQLISRGRINLSDELHGTSLASVAAPSPECERALPLIAARDDAQLEPGSPDAAWLDGHLAGCERCRLGVEAMQKAHASYRAWAPIAAARPGRRKPRRPAAIAIGLAALLLLAGLAAALPGSGPSTSPVDSAAGTTVGPRAAGRGQSADHVSTDKSKKRTEGKAAGVEAGAEEALPVQIASGGGSGDEPASSGKSQSGDVGVQPTQPTSDRNPTAAAPAPAPTSTAAQATTPEEAEKTHGRAEPPGKPADRPPK
jgi:DNA-directed RNA polymerase specialized sigma24 family protein